MKLSVPYVSPSCPDLLFYSYRFFKTPRTLTNVARYVYDVSTDAPEVRRNYSPTMEPHTLLYKLAMNQYQEYLFGYHKDVAGTWRPALGGGYQITDEGIFILSRLFVVPHYRMRLYIQHLLAALVDHLERESPVVPLGTKVTISFNKCNAALYEWFVRKASGRSAAIGKQWPEVFAVFTPAGLREVNNVEQYVCDTTFGELLNVVSGQPGVRRHIALSHKERGHIRASGSTAGEAPSVVSAGDFQSTLSRPDTFGSLLDPLRAGVPDEELPR